MIIIIIIVIMIKITIIIITTSTTTRNNNTNINNKKNNNSNITHSNDVDGDGRKYLELQHSRQKKTNNVIPYNISSRTQDTHTHTELSRRVIEKSKLTIANLH